MWLYLKRKIFIIKNESKRKEEGRKWEGRTEGRSKEGRKLLFCLYKATERRRAVNSATLHVH